jgi:DNA-binding LytR/AlgR family response regulator
MQGYLRIVLPDKKIMTKQSFSSLLGQLPEARFIQVHKSWIVAISKIESIERNRIKIGSALIPISDTYGMDFLRYWGLVNNNKAF